VLVKHLLEKHLDLIHFKHFKQIWESWWKSCGYVNKG